MSDHWTTTQALKGSFTNYCEFVRSVVRNGNEVSPRGYKTFELRGTEFSFDATRMFYRPGINPALGWAELLMILGGVYDPAVIEYAAPRADLSLFNPKLQYGPRVRDQYPGLVETLLSDPTTREAILVIGSGDDGASWDQPCTTSIQFLLRGGQLDSFVSMRSQDLIKGLPYDVVMMGGLTQSVAAELDVHPGWVTVRHGSAHVYESDCHLVPLREKTRRYYMTVPVLAMLGGLASNILGTDWRPTPDIVTCTEWSTD